MPENPHNISEQNDVHSSEIQAKQTIARVSDEIRRSITSEDAWRFDAAERAMMREAGYDFA